MHRSIRRVVTSCLMILIVALTIMLAVPTAAWACIWDRDTLAAEAKGVPGVVEVIVGRFERNPPLFYEMRLKRVAAEIDKTPQKLDLYDDAGVACDRKRTGSAAVAVPGRCSRTTPLCT